jgi:heptosyltransferase I
LTLERILLVKTSSMGDVVHNFPVLSDLAVHFPGARIDWVVEEAFAPIVRLHPMVNEIIPVSVRRWRRTWLAKSTWREIGRFRRRLRDGAYQATIDTQGLFKSALLAWCAPGRRYGMDWASSREPIGWFYDEAIAVPWDRHAVERNRLLASKALGYPLSGPASYALQIPSAARESLVRRVAPHFQDALKRKHAVLLHATSAFAKEWPEARWGELGSALAKRGILSLLPFGTPAEEERSERLANRIPGALVPPRLPLDALAALLGGANLVCGVDTGLSHLAAALGIPTIGIYCATDPGATGLYGVPHALNLGRAGSPPTAEQVVIAADKLAAA